MTDGDRPKPFAVRLRELLDENDLRVRELARRLAGPDAAESKIEKERRALGRYLSGEHVPKRTTTVRIAAALGVPADSLPSKEDEPRSPRGADLLAEMHELIGQLTTLLGEAGAEAIVAGSVESRLESLEVAAKETTKALRGVTRRLASLEDVLARQEPGREAEAR